MEVELDYPSVLVAAMQLGGGKCSAMEVAQENDIQSFLARGGEHMKVLIKLQ